MYGRRRALSGVECSRVCVEWSGVELRAEEFRCANGVKLSCAEEFRCARSGVEWCGVQLSEVG